MTLHVTHLTDIRTNCDVNEMPAVYYKLNIWRFASHNPALEPKVFRDRTEAPLFRLGTVPVPVLVLSLITSHGKSLRTVLKCLYEP